MASRGSQILTCDFDQESYPDFVEPTRSCGGQQFIGFGMICSNLIQLSRTNEQNCVNY